MGCTSDGYFGSGVILKKAVEKYGLDGFERTILRYHYGDQFALYAIEENYLINVDAAEDRNSYNLKNKGLGQDPAVTSAIFKGRKKRPESIARRIASLEASGKAKGVNNPRARAVINLSTHGIFPYARLGAESVGGTDAGISEACTKGYRHRGHFWMFKDEWDAHGQPEFPVRFLERIPSNWVVVCLTDGSIYMSTLEAQRAHNGLTGLSSALTRRLPAEKIEKSFGGHYWMYWKDWEKQGEPLREWNEFDHTKRDQVVELQTGRIFKNSGEAGRELGRSSDGIADHCNGATRDQRFMWLTDWENAGKPMRNPVKQKGEVRRIKCLKCNRVYKNQRTIASAHRISQSTISSALQTDRPICSDHRIVYLD